MSLLNGLSEAIRVIEDSKSLAEANRRIRVRIDEELDLLTKDADQKEKELCVG